MDEHGIDFTVNAIQVRYILDFTILFLIHNYLTININRGGNLDYIRKGPSDTDHLSIMHRAAEFGSSKCTFL